MNQAILDEAKRIFEIAKKAGLVDTFETIFNPEYMTRLYEYQAETKKKALNPSPSVKLKESLWDEAWEARKELIPQMIEMALDQNKGFVIDWRGALWEMVPEINKILPEAQIAYLSEEKIEGKWFQKIDINGIEHKLALGSTDLVIDQAARVINPYLEEYFGLMFITTDIGYDDHYYLLIKKESERDFVDLGFFRP